MPKTYSLWQVWVGPAASQVRIPSCRRLLHILLTSSRARILLLWTEPASPTFCWSFRGQGHSLAVGVGWAFPCTSPLVFCVVPDSTSAVVPFLSCFTPVQFLFGWGTNNQPEMLALPFSKTPGPHPSAYHGSWVWTLWQPHLSSGSACLTSFLFEPWVYFRTTLRGSCFLWSHLLWTNLLETDLLNRNKGQFICSITDQIVPALVFQHYPLPQIPFVDSFL